MQQAGKGFLRHSDESRPIRGWRTFAVGSCIPSWSSSSSRKYTRRTGNAAAQQLANSYGADVCEHDMLVLVQWRGRKVAVPLSQPTASDPDE
jgi:Tfp pilus assembly protein PilW